MSCGGSVHATKIVISEIETAWLCNSVVGNLSFNLWWPKPPFC